MTHVGNSIAFRENDPSVHLSVSQSRPCRGYSGMSTSSRRMSLPISGSKSECGRTSMAFQYSSPAQTAQKKQQDTAMWLDRESLSVWVGKRPMFPYINGSARLGHYWLDERLNQWGVLILRQVKKRQETGSAVRCISRPNRHQVAYCATLRGNHSASMHLYCSTEESWQHFSRCARSDPDRSRGRPVSSIGV
jgi:hypothetical protein